MFGKQEDLDLIISQANFQIGSNPHKPVITLNGIDLFKAFNKNNRSFLVLQTHNYERKDVILLEKFYKGEECLINHSFLCCDKSTDSDVGISGKSNKYKIHYFSEDEKQDILKIVLEYNSENIKERILFKNMKTRVDKQN